VATLLMDVNGCGLRSGYKLKLNSYDLGVTLSCMTRCSRFGLNIRKWRAW